MPPLRAVDLAFSLEPVLIPDLEVRIKKRMKRLCGVGFGCSAKAELRHRNLTFGDAEVFSKPSGIPIGVSLGFLRGCIVKGSIQVCCVRMKVLDYIFYNLQKSHPLSNVSDWHRIEQ